MGNKADILCGVIHTSIHGYIVIENVKIDVQILFMVLHRKILVEVKF